MTRFFIAAAVLPIVAGCHLVAERASDPLCPPLRAFVSSVDPNVTREFVFYTSWGSGFKGDEEGSISKKQCVHANYPPAKAVCESLMNTGAVEFSGNNAKRAVSCLSKGTRFAPHMSLEQGSFSFSYGTDNRGALITVSFAEDEPLGAMALRVTADGY